MHPDSAALNDYMDDALSAAQRTDVDRHLESCAACRSAVNDLREIRQIARSLDPRDPPARSWSRLQRAIALEHGHGARSAQPSGDRASDARLPFGFAQGTPSASRGVKGSRSLWVGLAAAAALFVATAVGMRTFGARPPTPALGSVGPDDAAQAVEAELKQASEHYEKAIQGLEAIATSEKGALDPQTAATMQKNLAVIDQAITESRAAVRAQPASAPAQQSLLESFKAKLALLEDTVALINEMRKGNEAGAARIVSGLKGKG